MIEIRRPRVLHRLETNDVFYEEIDPGDYLREVIRCFWALEHDYRVEFHTHEHLWADVHFELIFGFGEPYYQLSDAGRERLPKNFVIGPFKKKLMLFSDGFTGFVAVRFQPWGVVPFARTAIPTLVGNIVAAEEVFGVAIRSIAEQLEGQDRRSKVQILHGYFTRLLRAECKQIASAPIAKKILTAQGTLKVCDLAKQSGLSSRHLERLFQSETGLSIKMFSRIVRFNHAKRLIEKNPNISLAQLTYETGYSDQAHFSKNFRELFDRSPAEFKNKLKEFQREAGNQIDVAFLQDR